MEGMQADRGAANMLGLWREQEGYTEDGAYLVLSGGDSWTGPAISTWFNGQGMLEVMNAMGYAASAVGNHEFDFGLDSFQNRLSQANFPYLSANIQGKEDTFLPSRLGIQPYTMIERNGLKLGIIGLTTTSTPFTTHPANIRDFEFTEYESALREGVSVLRDQGAELILAPTHICIDELTELALRTQDLHIQFFGGGHCNESFAEKKGEAVIVSGGYHLTSYAYVHLAYDPLQHVVSDFQYGVRSNRDGKPDLEIETIVSRWKQARDDELNVVIGYLKNEIPRRSPEMQSLIIGAWLAGYPQADVALTNLGGMRDRLPQGEITLAEIISMMPFENVLVEVRLSGKQLLEILQINRSAVVIGGIHQENNTWIVDKTGEILDDAKQYSVLVNDFMYAGGDNFRLLAKYDPDAYNTGVDWRQPVIEWILEQESSRQQPLDAAIVDLLGDG